MNMWQDQQQVAAVGNGAAAAAAVGVLLHVNVMSNRFYIFVSVKRSGGQYHLQIITFTQFYTVFG